MTDHAHFGPTSVRLAGHIETTTSLPGNAPATLVTSIFTDAVFVVCGGVNLNANTFDGAAFTVVCGYGSDSDLTTALAGVCPQESEGLFENFAEITTSFFGIVNEHDMPCPLHKAELHEAKLYPIDGVALAVTWVDSAAVLVDVVIAPPNDCTTVTLNKFDAIDSH